VNAEVYHDVVTRPAPVGVASALSMLGELRAAPMLHGFRGRPRSDITAAAEAISRISAAGAALGGRLRELEINPLIVGAVGNGCVAADFLCRLSTAGDSSASPMASG
jgi:acetate---CoA ligase (ADP-forming)